MQNGQKLSELEIEERAATAQAFLNDPMMTEVMEDIKMELLAILVSSPIGSQEASAAHAELKSVGRIRQRLQSFVTQKKMAAKYGTREQ